MNKIQELHQRVLQEFPNVQIVLEDNKGATRPDKCAWFLNVSLNGKSVAVEWRPDYPETLSFCNCGVYGCSGDITCHEIHDAIEIIRYNLKA